MHPLPAPTPLVQRAAEARLPTKHGEFTIIAYTTADGIDQAALTLGNPRGDDVIARLHSECLTGDVLGSQRCDCGPQLDRALETIAAAGRGVLVYLSGHEGRGIGLANKIKAYALQDQGYDTVDANVMLGFPSDARHYDTAAAILTDLGVASVRLMTNNPAKVEALCAAGVPVSRRLPHIAGVNSHNEEYLRTKSVRMDHHDLAAFITASRDSA